MLILPVADGGLLFDEDEVEALFVVECPRELTPKAGEGEIVL